MTYRQQVQKWYSSRRWKQRRADQLRAHPLCRMCLDEGRPTPATIADHVKPHKGDYELFWNGVLQSLCKHHHDSDKALIEAGKAPRQRFGADGWPVGT